MASDFQPPWLGYVMMMMGLGQDYKEGVTAVAEKRAPTFKPYHA